jgi:hypothetical protein
MFDDMIRIWCAVRIVGLDLAGGDRKDSGNSRAEETHTKRYAYAFPHGDSSPDLAAPLRCLRLYRDSLNSSVPCFDPCRKRRMWWMRRMRRVCGSVTSLQIVIQTAKLAISNGEVRQPI